MSKIADMQIEQKKQKEQKKYTFEEANEAATKYFFGDKLAANVWCNKYALRDKEGNFLELTPHDMHDRLAGEFARIDSEKYGLEYQERFDIYRDAMNQFSRIVPQGSPMAAVGNKYQVMSASNCVVVEPPDDSIAGIMKTGEQLAQLYKRRTGCGTDLSRLRPDGFHVNNAARTTSGAWSFADYYSYITRMIGQSGRRGALMLTLNVHHPDVEKFATMKKDLTKVTGANITIRLTDEFLNAVENDTDYEQRWPCEIEDGQPIYKKMVSAKKVWNTIINTATETAEPGLMFWDRCVNRLPAHSYPQFKSKSSNPCSEIILSAYDSCRLLSLNLLGFIKNAFTDEASFDWKLFKNDIHTAMQMIDNLVDIELELIEKIQDACGTDAERDLWQKFWESGHDGRRTGLGTHGLADMFAQLNIKYDSAAALDFADKLYSTLRDTAYTASVDMAETRGAFPVFNWETEKDNEFIRDLPEAIALRMARVGRRNISILTQAPTGSVSLLSKSGEFDRYNVSSGVEPVFRNNYTRRKKINASDINARIDFVDALGDKWQHFEVYHGNVQNYLDKTNTTINDLPEFFVTSDKIDWKFRVKLQGIEQLYLCHSISSTINLPRGTKSEVVSNIYMEGWKHGLKGVTVYVDGSRDGVLVSDAKKTVDTTKRPNDIIRMEAPRRPKEVFVDIHHHSVKGKQWVAIVGVLNDEPYEMFGGYSDKLPELTKKHRYGKLVRKAQSKYDLHLEDSNLIFKDILGDFNDPEIGWTTRLMSTALRHGVPIQFLMEQLSKDGKINSFNRVLARVLKKYIPDGKKVKSSIRCGNNCDSPDLIYTEGCVSCRNCAWEKCS